MEINIVPLGTSTPSVSTHIAGALRVLREEKNVRHELTAMGTIVEAGSLDKLLTVAKRMHQAVLAGSVDRVVTTIKIDERKDKPSTIEGKVRAVESGGGDTDNREGGDNCGADVDR